MLDIHLLVCLFTSHLDFVSIIKSNLVSISPEFVLCKVGEYVRHMENDLVFVFAGGELPTGFLQKAGIEITKRFGHIVKKHK